MILVKYGHSMTSSTTLIGMTPELVLHSIENDIDKIVVQSRDTDVLVVLLGHYRRKMPCTQLWLKTAMTHRI